jgi:hypothetical protein
MTPDRVTRRRAGQPARKFQASRGGAHGSQPPVIASRSAAPDEDSGVAVEVRDREEAIRVAASAAYLSAWRRLWRACDVAGG